MIGIACGPYLPAVTVDERERLPSASAIARIKKCPGSHKLSLGIEGIQTPEMREWRASGNRIHDWLHTHLGFRLGLGGSTATVQQSLVSLFDDEQDVADRCVEQTRTLIVRLFPDQTSVRLLQENRMWMYFPGPAENLVRLNKRFSGKADAIFMLRDQSTGLYKCLIIDFKTNRGDQEESPRNEQLRSLAVLLLVNLGFKVSSIDVAIVQPLVDGDPNPCCYELPDLHIAHNMLLDALAKSEMENPPFNPGYPQCDFCDAKHKCQALRDLRDSLNPDVAGASAAELAEWIDKAEPIVRAYNEAMAGLKEHLNLNPDAVPNWMLKDNAGDRVITDGKAAYDTLANAGLMDFDTFLRTCAKVGIGALKDGLVAFNKLKPKTKADRIINTTLAPFITRKPSEPSLVRK